VVNVHTATKALFEFLREAGAITGNVLSVFENALRDQLLALGVPRTIQTMILVAIMALLVLAALRLFVGVLRVAAVAVLLLIAIHFVVASMHG
jgi:hypothetical protein